MKFPRQELDVDQYLQKINGLLNDSSCHIFIDTNIISQLYRLNQLARDDFYTWVDSCSDRFHIPNWSVHEYSKRITAQNTKDYLSELTKAKTYSKELANISNFIKGYVGDSLLIGSVYDGRKDELFNDIDSVVNKFAIIANAINKNLSDHQESVHKEVLDKLNNYTLNSDIYNIIENLYFVHDLRFDGRIPPGFKDSDKTSNRIGDLIIWKEIVDFCKKAGLKKENAKVILISRDIKPDMVYSPVKQTRGTNPIRKEEDKIQIAHESLVYEFSLTTGSQDFYLISFYTLVQILASNYQNLALSFQIATEQENTHTKTNKTSCIADESTNGEEIISQNNEPDERIPEPLDNTEPEINNAPDSARTYSESALVDSNYNTSEGNASINECIENLKTYNWYKQNPAINKLITLSFNKIDNTQQNRDSFFVLGRNILQSADGTAGSAIHFMENLCTFISKWPIPFQKAFIDGCLYEVFFNSLGNIRPKAFKSLYFETLVNEINETSLTDAFDFINQELERKNAGRFVPKVNNDEKYVFEFTFSEKNEDNDYKTTSLKINGVDVSDTFKSEYGNSNFGYTKELIKDLSLYYAIPKENIEILPLPEDLILVSYIQEKSFDDILIG